MPGRLVQSGVSRLSRGIRRVLRARGPVAAVAALAVALAITIFAVDQGGPTSQGAVPAQRTWGHPKVAPPVVPASKTIGSIQNGKLVLGGPSTTGSAAQLTGAARPKGAVPTATKPATPKLQVLNEPTVTQLASPPATTADGYSPQTSQVVASQDSADRLVYRNADGTMTSMFFASPVNYRLPDGDWATINTTLEPVGGTNSLASPSASAFASPSPQPSVSQLLGSPDPTASASPTPPVSPTGGWQVAASGVPEWFAPTANAGVLVRIQLPGAGWAGFSVTGAADVQGQASGSTVSYPDALPDAELQYTAGGAGVTEDIVLSSPSAPAQLLFPLSLPAGVTAVAGQDGAIDLVNTQGTVLAVMPPASMTDSDISSSSGDGATSDGVTYQLVNTDGRQAVEMTLDQQWLDSPERVYPVTVDPSMLAESPEDSGGTTYVESGYPGNNSSLPEIRVGTYDGGSNVAESYINFANVATALKNDYVLGAYLDVFNTWSYSCSAREVDVYPVTQSWSVNNSYTWPGPSTGAAIGRASFAYGWVPLGSTISPCPANWVEIPLDDNGTSLINGWTHGTTPDDGLALGASATDSYAWKKFGSYNETNGNPFLAVTYTTDAATYQLASTRPVTQVTSTAAGQIAVTITNEGSSTWTSSNGYEMSYEAYSDNDKESDVAAHPVYTTIPASDSPVAPGGKVTLDVKINPLPVGDYTLHIGMYTGGSSPVAFEYTPPLAVGLVVADPYVVVKDVYPPSGFVSPTDDPQLSVADYVPSGSGAVTYQFTLTCDPLPNTTCPADTGGTSTGYTSPEYTVSPPLAWNEPYTWTVIIDDDGSDEKYGPVSITAEVPQPVITSRLGATGGAAGGAVDPQSGEYTTGATDAAVSVAGPPLSIVRTYNSADPRQTGAFGAGWSSVADMKVIPDSPGSATSDVVVTMANGQELRFGYASTTNSVVSYVSPFGSSDELQKNASGTWTMLTQGATYTFAASGVISQITSATGLSQNFTINSADEVTAITDAASGRALDLAWSSASQPHVTSVTISPAVSGDSGQWTYTYSGNDLTQVCDPTTGDCTSYTYGQSMSHYNSSVMDAGPRSYYTFGDASGSTTAADQVESNIGETDGTYTNVSLGSSTGNPVGPVDEPSGLTQYGGTFNGSSSYATLAPNLAADETTLSVGLWFKTTKDSGVLFAYQPGTIAAGYTSRHEPALYVGDNGYLYGEFYNSAVDPIKSLATVTNGNWNYVVLTASGDTQTMYLNGVPQNSQSGTINQLNQTVDVAGAGFWSDNWPAVPSGSETGYFNGSMADLAVYPTALTQQEISEQYALANTTSPELTQVALPSGAVSGQVSYNAALDRVASYTDSDGGIWTLDTPVTTGVKANSSIGNSEALSQATTAVTITDPAGRNETYDYNDLTGGQLTSYNRGGGTAPRLFSYNSAGFLDEVADEDGNSVALTTDVYGNVLSQSWTQNAAGPDICPPSGTCTAYYSYYENAGDPVSPENGELTAVRDARSSGPTDGTYLTSYAYNSAGELTSATSPPVTGYPSGQTTSYVYAAAGGTTAYGGSGTVPTGLLLSATNPAGAVTSYSYYSDGDLAQVTEPSALRTVYTYDAQGRALTSTVYSTAFPGGLKTSYTYNAMNQPLTVTSPAVTNPITEVTHTLEDVYAYNSDGNETSLTQSDLTGGDAPRVTSYTYDDHDRVATVTDPAGATTSYLYDSCGNIASMTNADGDEYDYTYNAYGEVTSVTMVVPPSGQETITGAGPTPTPTSGPTYTGTPPAASGNATDQNCESTAPVQQDLDGTATVLDSYSYDPAGLLAATEDAMGRITNYAYDAGEQLIQTTTTDPTTNTARAVLYTYDNAGNLASEEQAGESGGLITSSTLTDYTYDADNRLTSQVLDPEGLDRTTSYTYGENTQVASQTVANAAGSTVTTYGYDADGDQTSQTVDDGSAGNLTTTWTYNQYGQPITMVSPDGNVSGGTPANYTTSYSYDPNGALSQVIEPPTSVQTYASQTADTVDPVTEYGYDTFGDQTQVEDPDGNVTSDTYDNDGRKTSVTAPSYTPPGSSTPVTATTTYTYDGVGNLLSTTAPAYTAPGSSTSATATTCYSYDALGDMLTQTYPAASCSASPGQWAWTYDADGEQTSATDPTGAVSTATYDYFGDVKTSTQEIRTSSGTNDETTQYAYNYLGDPLTVTSPDSAVTTNTYDTAGELTSTSNSLGDTTSYEYNRLGDLSQVTNPDQTYDAYTYDDAGNLTSTAEWSAPPPAPATSTQLDAQSYGYDANGNLTSSTDGRGYTTTYAYNPEGQLTGEVQPVASGKSITTSDGYDPAGNQTSYTDGNQNTTWTTYNSWDLPQSTIEPTNPTYPTAADSTWTTSYDAAAQPVSTTEPGGVTVADSYDVAGDLTGQSGAGASATTPTRTFTYDLDGRLTSAATSAGTDSFTWNDAGELTAATGPSGNSSFTYNGDGLLASETDTAGTTGYTYNSADQLHTMTDPATGATLTYGYNADGQTTSIAAAEGSTQGDTEALAYNGLQQLTSDTVKTTAGATIAAEDYGYDADGDLTSKATSGLAGAGTNTYSYDEADRLASATTGGTTTDFGWDGDDNLTQYGSYAYNYNAQDELTSYELGDLGSTSLTYNANGSVASVTGGYGTFPFTSDAYGDLIDNGVQVNTYDALGRVVTDDGLTASRTLTYVGTSTQVASDGDSTYTYTPSGTLTGVGVQGGTTSQGTLAYTDSHGDLTGIYAPTASSMTASASYDAIGNVTTSGTMPDIGYQGDFADPGDGLVDMNARWYWPATDMFYGSDVSNGDPLPAGTSPSAYAYADGNPLTNTDPTGHFCITCDFSDVINGISEGVSDTIGAFEETADAFETVAALTTTVSVLGLGALLGTAWAVFGPAQSTASGCGVDIICPTYSGDYKNQPPRIGYWGPTTGTGNGTGPGSCQGYCGPPIPPPPPPPPPQDLYALGKPATQAPVSLRTAKRIAISTPPQPKPKVIVETGNPSSATPSGLSGISTALGQLTALDGPLLAYLQAQLGDIGTPTSPTAQGSSNGNNNNKNQASGVNAGNRNGNNGQPKITSFAVNSKKQYRLSVTGLKNRTATNLENFYNGSGNGNGKVPPQAPSCDADETPGAANMTSAANNMDSFAGTLQQQIDTVTGIVHPSSLPAIAAPSAASPDVMISFVLAALAFSAARAWQLIKAKYFNNGGCD